MPTLGADPDASEKEWDEKPVRRQGYDPRLFQLINYFAYHKGMQDMSKMCPPGDKKILAYTFSRLVKQGFTHESIKYAIDRFFQSWAKDHERPAMLFSKKDMLVDLLSEAEVVSGDPFLQWILDGLPDVSPLPDPKGYRKAIMLTCDDALRYPEVMADIIRFGFGYATVYQLLSAFEQIVSYNIAGKPYDRDDVDPALVLLSPLVDLPKELQSHVPSPKSVREKVDKMHAHVAGSVVHRTKKEMPWHEGAD